MADRRPTLHELPARFAVHMLVGSAMFVAVALAGVALGLFVSWIDGQQHVPRGIVDATHWLEYGLFAADAALFAIFVLRSTWLHAGEMLHAPLSRAADPTDEEADRA